MSNLCAVKTFNQLSAVWNAIFALAGIIYLLNLAKHMDRSECDWISFGRTIFSDLVEFIVKLEVFSEDIPLTVLWYNCGTKWP